MTRGRDPARALRRSRQRGPVLAWPALDGPVSSRTPTRQTSTASLQREEDWTTKPHPAQPSVTRATEHVACGTVHKIQPQSFDQNHAHRESIPVVPLVTLARS